MSDELSGLGQWASWYASQGWHVVPLWGINPDGSCRCGGKLGCKPGKHPRGDLARHAEYSATTDPEIVRMWWTVDPTMNIAVATAPSGLIVIDCDGEDGHVNFLNWYHSSVSTTELPPTVEARTGGGGRHIFFRNPGVDVAAKTRFIKDCDFKAGSGYVVVAPSNHASGNLYEWINSPADIAVATAPMELAETLALMKGGSNAGGGGEKEYSYKDAEANGPRVGFRDDFFNARAYQLRRQGVSAEAALADMMRIYDLMADEDKVGFDRDQVLWKFRHVYNDERIQPEDPVEIPDWSPNVENQPRDGRSLLNDDGNALLFAQQYVERIRYSTDRRSWYVWTGVRWVENAELVLDLARNTARSLTDLAAKEKDDTARQAKMRHAANSLAVGRIKAIPSLATSEPRLWIASSDFDTNPLLLNMPNGTFDFENGFIREHRREDFLSKSTAVSYDPNAEAPQWREWIRWVMNDQEDLVRYLQAALGYALTGDVSEQVIFLLWGTGANGKSTLLIVFETILGDYALHGEPDLLSPSRGAHTTGIADLQGRRFVVASETREGTAIDERVVKQLTGGDSITARHMYKDFSSYRPSHKLFFAMNHLPTITDQTHAMWRRIHVVPFLRQVPLDKQEKNLAERLIASEGPGILRWAIEGALEWRSNGLFVPDAVRIRTADYRSHQDVLAAFISEFLVVDGQGSISGADLMRLYEEWAAREGLDARERLGRNTLFGRLTERLEVRRGRVSGGVHGFIGVRARQSGEEDNASFPAWPINPL